MRPTNFRFDEQTTELLEKLKNESGASSKAEVVRKALQLLSVAQAAQKNGDHLIIRSDEEEKPEREILLY